MPADVAHERGVVRGHLGGGLDEPTRVLYVEIADAEPRQVAQHLKRDPESLYLRACAERRRELLNKVLGAHDLPEDGAVLLSEGDGDGLVTALLAVE